MRYVELHSASAFSFLEGASQPESLIERAVKLEMPAMALLDRNGIYGSARFHTSAKTNKVQAHIGAEVAVSSYGSSPYTAYVVATSAHRGTRTVAAPL